MNEKAKAKRQLGVLDLCHKFLREHVQPGDICVDATAGRGFDTKLLCELTGASGTVHAFDIQPAAIESTAALLRENGLTAALHLESHENMANYIAPQTLSVAVFNFGWLPGGDHSVFTRAESSIAALKAALNLLRLGGALALCIYYGGANGFSERDAITEFLASLDSRYFTVLEMRFPNRTGCPPFAVFVTKDHAPEVPL